MENKLKFTSGNNNSVIQLTDSGVVTLYTTTQYEYNDTVDLQGAVRYLDRGGVPIAVNTEEELDRFRSNTPRGFELTNIGNRDITIRIRSNDGIDFSKNVSFDDNFYVYKISPDAIIIPNLIGLRYDEARERVRELGTGNLLPATDADANLLEEDGADSYIIVEQNPDPSYVNTDDEFIGENELMLKSDDIYITVEVNTIQLPNLVGRTLGEAMDELDKTNYNLLLKKNTDGGPVTVTDEVIRATPQKIKSTYPVANSDVLPATTIYATMLETKVDVPDISGLTIEKAFTTLARDLLRLKVDDEIVNGSNYKSDKWANLIIEENSQNPKKNEKIERESIVTANSVADGIPEVRLGYFVGKTLLDVSIFYEFKEGNLIPDITEQLIDSSPKLDMNDITYYSVYEIVSQNPQPPSQRQTILVDKGSTVNFIVKRKTYIPNLYNLTIENAYNLYGDEFIFTDKNGTDIKAILTTDKWPNFQIKSQSIRAGEFSLKGTSIKLEWVEITDGSGKDTSDGTLGFVSVPSVIGLTIEDAETTIQAIGLSIERNYVLNAEVILTQKPGPTDVTGFSVAAGSTITLNAPSTITKAQWDAQNNKGSGSSGNGQGGGPGDGLGFGNDGSYGYNGDGKGDGTQSNGDDQQ